MRSRRIPQEQIKYEVPPRLRVSFDSPDGKVADLMTNRSLRSELGIRLTAAEQAG